MERAAGLTVAERLKWIMLGDLVFEDAYALWELVLPGVDELSLEGARSVRASAVSALLDGEMIYLFRLDGLDPNAASERHELRLGPAEARVRVKSMAESGELMADVWAAATELGDAAAKDPPSAVRKLWVRGGEAPGDGRS